MREFFRGWKRKLGVVTLLIACLLTASWVRSFATWDRVQMAALLQTNLGVESRDGVCVWYIGPMLYENTAAFWSSSPTGTWVTQFPIGYRWPVLYHEGFVKTNDSHIAKHLNYRIVLRYWSLVIPLTALSAWLLLSKPSSD